MLSMPIVNLLAEGRKLAESGRRVSVLWQHDDSLAFIARGREYRSEFHINPSDETMYMIKGGMRLHYRTLEGKEDVAVIAEGAMIYTPAGTPHSPLFHTITNTSHEHDLFSRHFRDEVRRVRLRTD